MRGSHCSLLLPHKTSPTMVSPEFKKNTDKKAYHLWGGVGFSYLTFKGKPVFIFLEVTLGGIQIYTRRPSRERVLPYTLTFNGFSGMPVPSATKWAERVGGRVARGCPQDEPRVQANQD